MRLEHGLKASKENLQTSREEMQTQRCKRGEKRDLKVAALEQKNAEHKNCDSLLRRRDEHGAHVVEDVVKDHEALVVVVENGVGANQEVVDKGEAG